MTRLHPSLKVCALVAVGMTFGLALQPRSSDSSTAAAQEKKATPSAEQRLRELKIELPAVSQPTNTLVNAVRVGDMLYVSGTGPGKDESGKLILGRLGKTDLDVKQGRAAARQVGLHVLAVVKAELGSLDKVQRLVKTFGMVNAASDFKEHPQVINGFSDLMVEVFGEENGKGARSAVGMSSLPNGIPVEIEAIFQIRK